MACLVRHFVYTFAVYLVLNEIAQPAWSQDNSNITTTTRHRREDRVKKASLVRKLMRKKPKDGNIRLMDGSHEHEGKVKIKPLILFQVNCIRDIKYLCMSLPKYN